MSYTSINPPFAIFSDSDGQPLENGNIWIGQANLDPQVNPISVYWDAGLTQLAGQPIKTLNGYPYNSGTPARMFVSSDYSILVQNKNNVTVYSSPSNNQLSSEFVTFIPSRAGSVERSVQSKLDETVSVKDFGAVGDGLTDDTSAIQAAINSFPTGKGTILFPSGSYLVTSTITISQDRINLVGEGPFISNIQFQPTESDICFFFGKGGEGSTDAGTITSCSMKGFSLMSSNTTLKKTGIELKDISLFFCDNVQIGSTGATTSWRGNGSIGVRIRGRELSSFSNMIVQANFPFVFARNTSFPSLSLDQFTFTNIFTACRGHLDTPAVYSETHFLFEPGSNFSNVSFDGYQSWNRGKNGILYDNTTLAAAGASYAMSVKNVRWEGTFGDDDTGYAFYFDAGAGSSTQTIFIENAYLGEIGNGYFFRKFENATLKNCFWARASGTALNLQYVNGNEGLDVQNCWWQTGCTAFVAAQYYPYRALKTANTSVIYRDAFYASAANRRDLLSGGALNEIAIDIVATAGTIVDLPFRSVISAVVILADSRGKYCIVGINAVSKATTLIYNDGTWSTVQGTAAKLNVYYDAGTSAYKIENNTGVSRTMYVQSLGSNQ